jgi:hypothetical protein
MNDFHDDELIRRLQRLGNLAPTADNTSQALARVRRALVHDPVQNLPLARKILLKRAAAAAVLLLAVGGVFAWLLPAPLSARATFADVQAAMKAPRSVTCRQTTRSEGKPDETTRLLILGNGVCRAEEADGNYTLTDTGKSRALLVNAKKHTASLILGVNVPQVNLYDHIKNLSSAAFARPLPGKKIAGKDVLGFVVKVQGQDLTVWADARTKLPVRVEAHGKDEKGKTAEVIIDEFVFDKELDARLFSFEPPAGYQFDSKGVAELPAAPDDPRLKDLVVTPLVGIGPVKFRMPRADVEKLLGKPDEIQEMGKNGAAWNLNYGSRGFFIGVSKSLGVINFSCVKKEVMFTRARDFSGKTDKGIAMGASTADVIKAYGPSNSKETKMGSIYLSYGKLWADFTFFDDKLVQMNFYLPRPLQ